MADPFFLVESFTGPNATGNPAGVVLASQPWEAKAMQALANTVNQAETAFTWAEGDMRRLRWFTPAAEVNLCGHATLATAAVLAFERGEDAPFRFQTRSGELVCTIEGDRVAMDFPVDPPQAEEVPDALADWSPAAYYLGRDYGMAVFNSAAEVRSLKPDMTALMQLPQHAVVATAPGEGDADVVSRVFAPVVGIDEDHVTGSAHCLTTPFWAEKLGKDNLRCFQASPRSGWVDCTASGDRVVLAGQARVVVRGTVGG